MRAIRSTLCTLYALEALTCLWSVPGVVWEFVRTHAGQPPAPGPHIVVSYPVVVAGVVFAVTCGTFWRNQPMARWWGIASSGINIAFAAMMVFIVFYSHLWDPGTTARLSTATWLIAGTELGAGIAGVMAFGMWETQTEPKEDAEEPPRIEGDGTHRLIDKLVWVIGFGGIVAATWGCIDWGHAQRLPRSGALPWYADCLIAVLAMVAVHEMGHALTGKLLGMRLRAFIVGPFQWRVRDGRWTFRFHAAELLATGGATAVVPTHPEQPRSYEIWMIAGGPIASLLTGAAALWAFLVAPHHAWRNEWQLLALFAIQSLIVAAINLLPAQTKKGYYSDGAQIYQLLSGGPWGDYHHAMQIVGASTVTALRPRDYDIAAMERAAEVITQGHRALHLRLLISSYYRDCGQMVEAGQALNAAEDVYLESASDIPVELYTPFVFGKAFIQRDAEGTREWWRRLEAKKPKNLNADYWLARAAWLWMEDLEEEARRAWVKGNTLAQRLPRVGAYEADRDKFARLGRELKTQTAPSRWHTEFVPVG